MVDVGKREDRMLDLISDYRKNRDATLDWIGIYRESGQMPQDQAEWLITVLKGEDV